MLACVALALAEPPAALLAVREETLPNGLRVVAHQVEGTPFVATRLVLPVGAAHDPPGRGGLAHLVEHLAYAGSRHAPKNSSDLWLEAAGGSTAASTNVDYTTFVSRAPARALPLALFLDSDRLGWLAPTEEGLAVQRAVVGRERAGDPQGDAIRHAAARVFYEPGHPYRRTVIGKAAELDRASLADVNDFARCHVRPDGALLVVVGDEPAEALLGEARRWFAEVPVPGETEGCATPEPVGPVPGTIEAPPDLRTAWVEWVPADLYRDDVRFLWRTVPAGHPDILALEAAAWVLADRLEVDGVSAWQWSGRRGGELAINATTTKPRSLVRRVEGALAKLLREGPRVEELARWRALVRTAELEALEVPEGRAEILASCVTRTGTPDCLPATWAARERISAEDVRDVAVRRLRPDTRLLVVASSRPPDRLLTRSDRP